MYVPVTKQSRHFVIIPFNYGKPLRAHALPHALGKCGLNASERALWRRLRVPLCTPTQRARIVGMRRKMRRMG